jgi:hypothetical protein
MEPTIQKKTSGISIFGFFLIFLGAGLLLNKLHVLHYTWGMILWGCLGVVGFAAVVQAFVTRRRGVVFWGSLLFFVSVLMIIHRSMLFDFAPWDAPAAFSLALGFSFLMQFIYDPRRIGVLVPILFFGGYGVLYYLWWWDVIDWFELKQYVRLYWPVLVILWGFAMIFGRRTKPN